MKLTKKQRVVGIVVMVLALPVTLPVILLKEIFSTLAFIFESLEDWTDSIDIYLSSKFLKLTKSIKTTNQQKVRRN